MDTSSLLWGLLFGSIGIAYVVYGRRQRSTIAFVCGLALIGFPYLVSNAAIMVVAGLLLIAAPFVVRF